MSGLGVALAGCVGFALFSDELPSFDKGPQLSGLQPHLTAGESAPRSPAQPQRWFGAVVSAVHPQEAEALGLAPGVRGVIVDSVFPGMAAAQAVCIGLHATRGAHRERRPLTHMTAARRSSAAASTWCGSSLASAARRRRPRGRVVVAGLSANATRL